MAKEAKSTKTLGYSLKGDLKFKDMVIVEYLDNEEEVVHDLNDIFLEFDNKEVTLSINYKDKLDGE